MTFSVVAFVTAINAAHKAFVFGMPGSVRGLPDLHWCHMVPLNLVKMLQKKKMAELVKHSMFAALQSTTELTIQPLSGLVLIL